MRHQPYADTAGGAALDASAPQVAVCPACKAVLEFDTDGMGNLREWCPRCVGRREALLRAEDRLRPNPATLRTPQPDGPLAFPFPVVANSPTLDASSAVLLPTVAPGQLRCQRCAQGVEGRDRFCSKACRYAGRTGRKTTAATREKMRTRWREGWTLERREKVSLVMRAARARGFVFAEKRCPCGITYRPTGPSQKYHAKDCPSRRAA